MNKRVTTRVIIYSVILILAVLTATALIVVFTPQRKTVDDYMWQPK